MVAQQAIACRSCKSCFTAPVHLNKPCCSLELAGPERLQRLFLCALRQLVDRGWSLTSPCPEQQCFSPPSPQPSSAGELQRPVLKHLTLALPQLAQVAEHAVPTADPAQTSGLLCGNEVQQKYKDCCQTCDLGSNTLGACRILYSLMC